MCFRRFLELLQPNRIVPEPNPLNTRGLIFITEERLPRKPWLRADNCEKMVWDCKRRRLVIGDPQSPAKLVVVYCARNSSIIAECKRIWWGEYDFRIISDAEELYDFLHLEDPFAIIFDVKHINGWSVLTRLVQGENCQRIIGVGVKPDSGEWGPISTAMSHGFPNGSLNAGILIVQLCIFKDVPDMRVPIPESEVR